MKNADKYTRCYFMPPTACMKWTQRDYIDKAPIWCSVDLRDGNQSLIVPMSLEEKLQFFQFLVRVGFKEIEVGFPAASETEYEFLRVLIEQDLIPDDVTIQVLTQSRKHIIQKTFEALKGVRRAIVHLYNSTSVAQREQVFRKSKDEIAEIAVSGARMVMDYAGQMEGDFRFEYSPESFTGTEMEFALEVCNRVLEVWRPSADKKVIINLPVTVSHSLPHVYASQIEYMCENLNCRENVIVSLHPHNDRGCAVADSELGLLAGADRIEGTLFGNGERTGNVDVVTLALNMYSHGVDPKLEFGNMPDVVSVYEQMTGMHVSERQPYAGKLVFAAFSGSHQDAIAKGMKWWNENKPGHWMVPYLPVDPKDLGREYDGDVIRINSQSGKGGIGYILERRYGYELPPKMREAFGYEIKGVSDHQHRELVPQEIYEIFKARYVNIETPVKMENHTFWKNGSVHVHLELLVNNTVRCIEGEGNGTLDAASNAVQENLDVRYGNLTYKEHALELGSKSQAVAYVSVTDEKGDVHWGVGVHNDIMTASIRALLSAVNGILAEK